MKKFVTEDSFWDLFPGASLGIVVAKGMKSADLVSSEDAEEIGQLLARANAAAERHLESPTLSENAPVRVWRQAYQQFKTKRGARCSIENLLKRVLKGNPVGSISPRCRHLQRRIAHIRAVPGRRGHRRLPRRPAPAYHPRRGRVHAARRECGQRPHAARRAVLCGRCRRGLPLLELARRRAHGANRRHLKRPPYCGVR